MPLHGIKQLSAVLGMLTIAVAPAAQAADLVTTKDTGYAAVDMPPLWAGFYVGAAVTGTFSGGRVQSSGAHPELKLSGDAEPGGELTLGYNWQFGSWVMGAEGNFNYSSNTQTGSNALLGYVKAHEYDVGSLQIRGGYALGNVLFFAMTGVEFTTKDVSYTGGDADRIGASLGVGVGVDYALHKNWFVRGEAKYFDTFERDVPFAGGDRDVTHGFLSYSLGIARKF